MLKQNNPLNMEDRLFMVRFPEIKRENHPASVAAYKGLLNALRKDSEFYYEGRGFAYQAKQLAQIARHAAQNSRRGLVYYQDNERRNTRAYYTRRGASEKRGYHSGPISVFRIRRADRLKQMHVKVLA